MREFPGAACNVNLQTQSVLKGIPDEPQRHVSIGLSPSTRYDEIRAKTLVHETRTQSRT